MNCKSHAASAPIVLWLVPYFSSQSCRRSHCAHLMLCSFLSVVVVARLPKILQTDWLEASHLQPKALLASWILFACLDRDGCLRSFHGKNIVHSSMISQVMRLLPCASSDVFAAGVERDARLREAFASKPLSKVILEEFRWGFCLSYLFDVFVLSLSLSPCLSQHRQSRLDPFALEQMCLSRMVGVPVLPIRSQVLDKKRLFFFIYLWCVGHVQQLSWWVLHAWGCFFWYGPIQIRCSLVIVKFIS